MPNPNQVGNSDSTQNTESSFAKMANEMPSFEEHIKQYKAEHPDAVEDIEKARAMAEAGNELETEAANEKRGALNALDDGSELYLSTNSAGKGVYSKESKINEDGSQNITALKDIKEAPDNIRFIKNLAHREEERAGEHYDEMQRLRDDIENS